MGIRPASSSAILSGRLSTQTTSFPRSAKTAPVTKPTYPVPTTQMFMVPGHHTRGGSSGGTGGASGLVSVSLAAQVKDLAHRSASATEPGAFTVDVQCSLNHGNRRLRGRA